MDARQMLTWIGWEDARHMDVILMCVISYTSSFRTLNKRIIWWCPTLALLEELLPTSLWKSSCTLIAVHWKPHQTHPFHTLENAAVKNAAVQERTARPLSPAAAAPPRWEGVSSFPFQLSKPLRCLRAIFYIDTSKHVVLT
eukprot:206274-Pelagomonas_calceolata.AAC.2